MKKNLYSLAYFSHGVPNDLDRGLHRTLRDILAVSRRNNPSLGVTGALLFCEGSFAQVLEGRRESVESIFEMVMGDPRHTRITVLSYQRVIARSFPDWPMAFAGSDAIMREQAASAGAPPVPDFITIRETGWRFLPVLRDHVRRHGAGKA